MGPSRAKTGPTRAKLVSGNRLRSEVTEVGSQGKPDGSYWSESGLLWTDFIFQKSELRKRDNEYGRRGQLPDAAHGQYCTTACHSARLSRTPNLNPLSRAKLRNPLSSERLSLSRSRAGTPCYIGQKSTVFSIYVIYIIGFLDLCYFFEGVKHTRK